MRESLYEKLVVALENNFSNPEDFIKLELAMLEAFILDTLESESFDKYKEEVRRALAFFFTNRGLKSYIFFKTQRNITLKIRICDFDSNIYTQFVLKKIGNISSNLLPIKNKSEVFLLDEKISNIIYDFLSVIEDEEERKGTVRSILKLSLSLQSRDAIFLVNNQIIIKKFKEESSPKEQRLFNGIPEETLLEMEHKALQNGLKTKIPALAKHLSAHELSFSLYDNIYFAKNFIQILQEKFLLLIPEEAMKLDSLTQQAYANFLLRRYFDVLMFHLAEALLELLVQKNHKADNFIRFYNGEVSFSPEGKRFQKPEIIDSEGNRWNSSTLFQVILQHQSGIKQLQNNQEDIAKTKETIKTIQGNIDELERFLADKYEEIQLFEAKFKERIKEFEQAKSEIFDLNRFLQEQKNSPKAAEIQEKIRTLSTHAKHLRREDERMIDERKRFENEVEKAKIKIVTLKKDKIAFERKLERNLAQRSALKEKQTPLDERYKVATDALSKAMSSFRGY